MDREPEVTNNFQLFWKLFKKDKRIDKKTTMLPLDYDKIHNKTTDFTNTV